MHHVERRPREEREKVARVFGVIYGNYQRKESDKQGLSQGLRGQKGLSAQEAKAQPQEPTKTSDFRPRPCGDKEVAVPEPGQENELSEKGWTVPLQVEPEAPRQALSLNLTGRVSPLYTEQPPGNDPAQDSKEPIHGSSAPSCVLSKESVAVAGQ